MQISSAEQPQIPQAQLETLLEQASNLNALDSNQDTYNDSINEEPSYVTLDEIDDYADAVIDYNTNSTFSRTLFLGFAAFGTITTLALLLMYQTDKTSRCADDLARCQDSFPFRFPEPLNALDLASGSLNHAPLFGKAAQKALEVYHSIVDEAVQNSNLQVLKTEKNCKISSYGDSKKTIGYKETCLKTSISTSSSEKEQIEITLRMNPLFDTINTPKKFANFHGYTFKVVEESDQKSNKLNVLTNTQLILNNYGLNEGTYSIKADDTISLFLQEKLSCVPSQVKNGGWDFSLNTDSHENEGMHTHTSSHRLNGFHKLPQSDELISFAESAPLMETYFKSGYSELKNSLKKTS